jgi:uncharacterized protein YjbJ (UPF0337 family)
MGMSKDEVKSRINDAEGGGQEAAGNLPGNETLEAKGELQAVIGKAQAKFGDIKQAIKDAKKARLM